MDKNLISGDMAFRTQNLPKLPHHPLSVCSRLAACGQNASSENSGKFFNSFINFKIEIVNIFSSPSSTFETPIKKPLGQNNLSPDLGCVMDYCSPLTRWKTMSPLTDSFQDCLDTTWDSSSPLTLPHHEQEKFELVGQYTTTSQQKARLLPWKYLQEDGTATVVKSERSGILNKEVDWEQKKTLYVLVLSCQDVPRVMSELLNLMSHVADQTTSSSGTRWQHPSDLTRRNYQRCVGKQSMTLHEWQTKNCPTYRRFVNVPKIFKRNQFP